MDSQILRRQSAHHRPEVRRLARLVKRTSRRPEDRPRRRAKGWQSYKHHMHTLRADYPRSIHSSATAQEKQRPIAANAERSKYAHNLSRTARSRDGETGPHRRCPAHANRATSSWLLIFCGDGGRSSISTSAQPCRYVSPAPSFARTQNNANSSKKQRAAGGATRG